MTTRSPEGRVVIRTSCIPLKLSPANRTYEPPAGHPALATLAARATPARQSDAIRMTAVSRVQDARGGLARRARSYAHGRLKPSVVLLRPRAATPDSSPG